MTSSTLLIGACDRLHTSCKFVPVLLSLTAAVASVPIVRLDHAVAGGLPRDAWQLYGGNAGNARAAIATIDHRDQRVLDQHRDAGAGVRPVRIVAGRRGRGSTHASGMTRPARAAVGAEKGER